ncbi:MAG: ribose ABC transporter permease [Candidatus Meridianibacter frigidus]|nr:MAG: ribose ABC transporter permease [Candidatus Eremiobacteraeota bacterium]
MADAQIKAAVTEEAEVARAKAARTYWLRLIVAAVGFLIVVSIANRYSGGSFLQPSNLIRVLRQITYEAILAFGQTFVIITAGIDLSVGSLVSLTGVVMALVANASGLHGFPLIAVTLLCGLAVGALAGWVNALPVVKLNLPPFITTLAMMLMALGLSYKLAGGRPIPVIPPDFENIGYGTIGPIPIVVVWMIAIAVIASVLLMRTRFGRYVFALGGNEEAARLAGIGVGRVKTLVYVISGICAAFVGFLLMANFSSGSPNTGTGDELLESIAAVVVGGTSLMGGRGSIVGTFFGALLIGVLYNVMNLIGVESYTQKIVLGAVILLAVILDELRKRYIQR